MGNRSFLYIAPANSTEDDIEEIADANNLLPTLWQVLLASGTASTPIDYQRVFGDGGTANIGADARTGLNRYKKLAAFIRQHPQFNNLPGLGIHLDAVELHLHELIEKFTDITGTIPILSANLDELSWLDDVSPAEFISQTIADCNQLWHELENLIADKNFSLLEDYLGFTDWNLTFKDWNAWSIVFGLCLFQHPYFSSAEREPRLTEYADFDPDDDEFAGDNYLGSGLSKFKENGLWGVKNDDGKIIIAAEWQRIKRADHEDYDVKDNLSLVWLMREKKFALAAVNAEQKSDVTPAYTLLTPAILDEVWGFNDDLAVVRQNGLMGYLQRDGHWRLPPAWTEAWDFAYGFAQVASHGKFGFINSAGQQITEMEFDEISDFNADGIAWVSKNGRQALIRTDGSAALADCDNIIWQDDLPGYIASKRGKQALLDATGKVCLDFDWDEIRPLVKQALVVVKRANSVGAYDWQAHCVLPVDFSEIELFEPQYGVKAQVINTQQLRVKSWQRLKEHRLWGLWDIAQNGLIVPCSYRYIWLVMLSGKNRYGFVVAQENAKHEIKQAGKYRMQLLDAEGKPLFAAYFSWIGENLTLGKP
ncbi:MAG: WG repeat-containing protein, partial [Methylococcales bacterium]